MTDLKFYNSLTKTVGPLSTQEPGKVRIYNCGPTVYKRQHIGNMRRFLFADFLRRTLEFFGYEVRDITNITDVGHLTQDDINAGEDKMEKAAREAKKTPQQIADTQIMLFEQDLRELNIQPAHLYPRASQHIEAMQKLISQLIEKGHAYTTSTGVYFDVQSFPAYGRLSGNTLEALQAGARVAVREEKKHPADFALWVLDTKQIQTWDSPWGKGYPGWHIECSAMSLEYLGEDIDIHTGGEDNIFPHHENEIAQSEGATSKRFVRLWMHNRHLQLAGKKLSKREGEQITLDTVKEKGFSPLALRTFLFSTHYHTLAEFSWEGLTAAQEHVDSVRQLLRRFKELGIKAGSTAQYEDVLEEFSAALADDLNTPKAWAVFLTFLKTANTSLDASSEQADALLATLKKMDLVIGIMDPLLKELGGETIPTEIMELAQKREILKQEKKFDQADAVRSEVAAKGYKIEDTAHGPRVIKSN